MFVEERLVVLPANPPIESEFRRDLPGILQVKSKVVGAEVRDGGANLAFRVMHGPEQEIGHRRPGRGPLCCREQRILSVAAIEIKASPRNDATDLIVADPPVLAAELVSM